MSWSKESKHHEHATVRVAINSIECEQSGVTRRSVQKCNTRHLFCYNWEGSETPKLDQDKLRFAFTWPGWAVICTRKALMVFHWVHQSHGDSGACLARAQWFLCGQWVEYMGWSYCDKYFTRGEPIRGLKSLAPESQHTLWQLTHLNFSVTTHRDLWHLWVNFNDMDLWLWGSQGQDHCMTGAGDSYAIERPSSG